MLDKKTPAISLVVPVIRGTEGGGASRLRGRVTGEEQHMGLLWKAMGVGVIQLRSLRLRKAAPGVNPWFPVEAGGLSLGGRQSSVVMLRAAGPQGPVKRLLVGRRAVMDREHATGTGQRHLSIHPHKHRVPAPPVWVLVPHREGDLGFRAGSLTAGAEMPVRGASLTLGVPSQDEQRQEHGDQCHALGQSPALGDWPHHQLLPAGRGHRRSRGLPPHRGLGGEAQRQGEGLWRGPRQLARAGAAFGPGLAGSSALGPAGMSLVSGPSAPGGDSSPCGGRGEAPWIRAIEEVPELRERWGVRRLRFLWKARQARRPLSAAKCAWASFPERRPESDSRSGSVIRN